ncbi:hypothetical protein ABIE67_000998 [Streptomyces sp. V4I8]
MARDIVFFLAPDDETAAATRLRDLVRPLSL